MKDWRFWFAEQRSTFMAVAIFAVMFFIYASNHPAGFSANVVQTASNKGVLLAFVAMAQCLVVITAGIDLSVGMIFTLTNCLASWLVSGSPLQVTFGIIAVLIVGGLCGAINGLVVIYGRLQPIVATIATGAIYYGIALALRPFPGGTVDETVAEALTGKFFNLMPASLVALVVVVLVVWVPFSRPLREGQRMPSVHRSLRPICRAFGSNAPNLLLTRCQDY